MVELLVLALFILGITLYYAPTRKSKRVAINVLEDLREEQAGLAVKEMHLNSSATQRNFRLKGRRLTLPTFVQLGFGSQAHYQSFLRLGRFIPVLVSLLFVALGSFFMPGLKLGTAIVLCVMGLSVGYLIAERRKRARQEYSKNRIEFFLPMAMERLVMGVLAGLDLLPAIKCVIDQDQENTRNVEHDPVSGLFRHVYQLTEAGLGFEQALADVSDQIDVPALKHSFVYLGLAHREGGDLVGPLRELSDATQAYYQESVDETIAKMPVKATLPLVLTFLGLILCFVTVPIAQMGTMLGKARVSFKE